MTAAIGGVWGICLLLAIFALFGDDIIGSDIATIAGALGWVALALTFQIAGESYIRKANVNKAYRGILAMAKDGRCVNDLDFECLHESLEECGACWAMILGHDPEDWLEWYKAQKETSK